MTVSVYLPCRAGSERVKDKNTRNFSGNESLLTRKIKTLLNCEFVDEVCISTNDQIVAEQAQSFNNKRVKIFERSNELCLSTTKTDDLVFDMQNICSGDVFVWTHVTSPFMTETIYNDMFSQFQALTKHDSLMTVTKHQTFLWYDDKPLNYDRSIIRWPNTQNLPPVWEINSGAFIINRKTCKQTSDRIGHAPYLYRTDYPFNIDIDTMFDFEQAVQLSLNMPINQ